MSRRLKTALIFFPVTVVTALLLYAGAYDAAPETRTFLDRSGKIVGTVNPAYDGLQFWTPLDRIPREAVEKTLKTEDRWFHWHRGLNPFSLAKAAWEDLTHGRVVRGGSTITQQLAKNLMRQEAPSKRTFWNKFRETLLALGLEMKHSKEWILERYLNTAYYGRRSYGLAAAAQAYFGKGLGGLSSEEIDFLVSRPKAPNRNVGAVQELHPPAQPVARHFLEYASHNLSPTENTVQTTLDIDLQTKLEGATARLLASRASEDPKLTAAVVVLDVKTGGLLAMVGSRDYFDEDIDGQVNAAVALRQPGSTLKPFTYFAAFAKGFGPDTIVPDEPLSFQAPGIEDSDSYAPQNFDRRYHGAMTIREALANSYNIPAVVTLNEIGLSAYHDLLRRFGFTTLTKPPLHYGLAVTLGSGEVTLLELTNAYAALARGGMYLPYRMTPVTKTSSRFAPTPVLTNAPQYASEVTDILSDATARLKAFGFNESMVVGGHDVAVKTGTSYDYRDNWTVGYTPSYAVGVWVGHADGSPMTGGADSLPTTGATGAAPLWHAAMELVLKDTVAERFPKPAERVAKFTRPEKGIELAELRDAPKGWRVSNPVPNETFRIHPYLPVEHQKIAAEAQAGPDQRLTWYLDDRFLASTQGEAKVWIVPSAGKHRLKAEAEDGSHQEIAFRITTEETN